MHTHTHAGLAASSHNTDILPDLLAANPSVVDVAFATQAEADGHMPTLDEHEEVRSSHASDMAPPPPPPPPPDDLTTPRGGGDSEFMSLSMMNHSSIEQACNQTTILCWCIREKRVALVKKLIELDADVNMREPATGNTPLMLVGFCACTFWPLSVPCVLNHVAGDYCS